MPSPSPDIMWQELRDLKSRVCNIEECTPCIPTLKAWIDSDNSYVVDGIDNKVVFYDSTSQQAADSGCNGSCVQQGKYIYDFLTISDDQLANNHTLRWVVGDNQGTLYQPTIPQMQTLMQDLIPPQTPSGRFGLEDSATMGQSRWFNLGLDMFTYRGGAFNGDMIKLGYNQVVFNIGGQFAVNSGQNSTGNLQLDTDEEGRVVRFTIGSMYNVPGGGGVQIIGDAITQTLSFNQQQHIVISYIADNGNNYPYFLKWDDNTGKIGMANSLPIATATTLGVIKVGNGLLMDGNSKLNAVTRFGYSGEDQFFDSNRTVDLQGFSFTFKKASTLDFIDGSGSIYASIIKNNAQGYGVLKARSIGGMTYSTDYSFANITRVAPTGSSTFQFPQTGSTQYFPVSANGVFADGTGNISIGSAPANAVTYWGASNTITGEAEFNYNPSNNTMGMTGGGIYLQSTERNDQNIKIIAPTPTSGTGGGIFAKGITIDQNGGVGNPYIHLQNGNSDGGGNIERGGPPGTGQGGNNFGSLRLVSNGSRFGATNTYQAFITLSTQYTDAGGTNNEPSGGYMKMIMNNYGQVGIGTSQLKTDGSYYAGVDPSAILQIDSPSTVGASSGIYRGVLIPRMVKADRDKIVNPAIGLMIFNIEDATIHIYTGSSGNGWQKVNTSNAT